MAKRVLVVDDDEGMREIVQETLERLELPVEVCVEGDSTRALTRLGDESFDLLITDIHMPKLDGVGLLKAARERDPALPVLIMTGFPSVESAVACLKLGAVSNPLMVIFALLDSPRATGVMAAPARPSPTIWMVPPACPRSTN